MSRTPHDTPYRDDPSPQTARSRDTSSARARKPTPPRKSPPAHEPRAAASAARKSTSREPRHSASTRKSAPAPEPRDLTAKRPSRRRSGRRGKGGGPAAAPVHLTSQATTRIAYGETRAWLLKQHGPVCAYCGRTFTAKVMTMDHVAPRRGQTAYDRRDNLVLACPGCNTAKKDLAPLAFLLGSRGRAANLLRYGEHLSTGLLDLARSLAPTDPVPATNGASKGIEDWPPLDDGESPYSD